MSMFSRSTEFDQQPKAAGPIERSGLYLMSAATAVAIGSEAVRLMIDSVEDPATLATWSGIGLVALGGAINVYGRATDG